MALTNHGLILALISSAALWMTHSKADEICPTKEFLVPFNSSGRADYIDAFPQVPEAALHLFPGLAIKCDGYLTKWRFLLKNAFVKQLYLGVFRSTNDLNVVELVGSSFFGNMKSPRMNPRGVWLNFKQKPPIPVRSGDFLGFFYQSNTISPADLTIVARSNPDPMAPKAFVTKMRNSSDILANRKVDISEAQWIDLVPALFGIISGTLATEKPKPTTTFAPVVQPVELNNYFTPYPAPQPQYFLQPPAYQSYSPSSLTWATSTQKQIDPACLTKADPFNSMFCFSISMRYFFDAASGTCSSQFGCTSTNNFATYDECMSKCQDLVQPQSGGGSSMSNSRSVGGAGVAGNKWMGSLLGGALKQVLSFSSNDAFPVASPQIGKSQIFKEIEPAPMSSINSNYQYQPVQSGSSNNNYQPNPQLSYYGVSQNQNQIQQQQQPVQPVETSYQQQVPVNNNNYGMQQQFQQQQPQPAAQSSNRFLAFLDSAVPVFRSNRDNRQNRFTDMIAFLKK